MSSLLFFFFFFSSRRRHTRLQGDWSSDVCSSDLCHSFKAVITYKFLMTALKLWQEYPNRVLSWFKGAEVRMEVGPELMGVGYIIGPGISGFLFAGGCLAYLVLMPAIKLFGEAMTAPMYPATKLIKDMSAGENRAAFVFCIGAGALATAGIIALARALPTI